MADKHVFLCVPEREATQLQVTIPGMGVLRSAKQEMDKVMSPHAMAMVMLAQVSPALSPIIAILRVVDALNSIVQTFKSISLSSLSDLQTAITKLVGLVGLLSEYLPGIVYAKAVRDMINMTQILLHGAASLITRWVAEMAFMQKAVESAQILGDTDLQLSTACTATRLIEVQQATQVSLQDVGAILKVIKLIADIVAAIVPVMKIPGLSTIGDIVDTLTTTLASPLGATADAAEQARLLEVAGQLQVLADQLETISITITKVIG
jgi:hypothetical protein